MHSKNREDQRRVKRGEDDRGQHCDEERDDRGRDRADVEVFERADVGDDPCQQVTAGIPPERRRGARLDGSVEPGAYRGERRER